MGKTDNNDNSGEDQNRRPSHDHARLRGYGERARARAGAFFESDSEMPLSRHILLVMVAAFVVIFIVWANWATLDEVTRGRGQVMPAGETKTIQHLEGGIIEKFFVNEGDIVDKGDLLMRLSDVSARSNLQAKRTKYLGLKAAVSRLRVEAEGKSTLTFDDKVKEQAPDVVAEQRQSFKANKAELQSKIEVLREKVAQKQQEVEEARSRINNLRKVIELSREEKSMIAPLVRQGSAPKIELIQLDRKIQEKVSELERLQQSLPRLQSAVKESEARISQARKNARARAQEKLSEKMSEMNSIKEELTALKDKTVRRQIRAPVRGEIKEIFINTVGGVVKPGEKIMDIVPVEDQLLVEARIAPKDIAFLYPGQKAVVKITAYDYSIYGGLKGEVVRISPDTITKKDKTFYKVRVKTNDDELVQGGETLPIKPGMVASVDILTGEKTVMEYLLKPFIKTLDKAMNER